MKIKSVVLLTCSIINLSINVAIAQPKVETKVSQNSVQTLTPYEQQTKQIEEIQRSQVIEKKVKEEVERTFNAVFQSTINLINWNIGIINFLLIVIPIGGAICLWLFQTSIITKFELDTRKELENQIDETYKGIRDSVQEQININKERIDGVIQEITKKISETETLTAELEKFKLDTETNIQEQAKFVEEELERQKEFVDSFRNEVKDTIRETQQARDIMEQEKDRIIQELSKLAPPLASIPDTHQPDIQKQIQELTKQLEDLKLANPQLFLTTDDYLKQGDAFFFEGNYKEAIKSYDEVIKRQDNSFSAWASRGWALRRIDKFQEALKSYEKAVDINPDNHIGWYGRGNVLRELEQYDEAINAYNKSLEIKPDFFWSWFRLGRCYLLTQNEEKALEYFRKAKELDLEIFEKLVNSKEEFHSMKELQIFQELFEK